MKKRNNFVRTLWENFRHKIVKIKKARGVIVEKMIKKLNIERIINH